MSLKFNGTDGITFNDGTLQSTASTGLGGGDGYTKEESDAIDNAQDAKIVINNDDIARQQIEIDNQQTSIDKNTSDITANIGNISSNTTAVETLSGQVSQNSEDISELQDSVFFTSAYTADYPSSPNRDPETGNMYLQNFAMFTYSYAEATQIFASKTDESGNVRQFTAVKAGDSIVLNEVNSPNYGRYELVSIEDVDGNFVVMTVVPKLGQGTVIKGVKVAFQAFPKAGGGTGDTYTKAEIDAQQSAQDTNINKNDSAIISLETKTDNNLAYIADNVEAIATKVPEAPIDGKQYGRQDAEWTEVTGGGSGGGGDAEPPVILKASFSTTSSIPNNAWTPITFDVADVDTNDGLDVANKWYKPNVAGYYNVAVSTYVTGTGLIRGISGVWKNDERVQQGTETYNASTPVSSITSLTNTIVYCNGTTDYIQPKVLGNSTSALQLGAGAGTQLNISRIASSSSGGGYTPEPMVWEDKTSERTTSDTYTNTADTAINVIVGIYHPSPTSQSVIKIDGDIFGYIGSQAGAAGTIAPTTTTFTVPSGSNYAISDVSGVNSTVQAWHEAVIPATAGGDSIWTESGNDIYVTNNSNGLYINTAGTNSVNLIGYNGSTFDDIWLRGGGAPDTGLGVMADGSIIASQDMTVNGVNVGKGSGTGENTSLGKLSLSSNSTGNYNVGVGYVALGANETGAGNTGLGFQALSTNVGGNDNTCVGVNSGSTLTSGSNNTLIGNNAQTSADGVSNEVTIGNDDVTLTRLKGRVQFSSYPDLGLSPSAPNVFISTSGHLYESSAAFYSTKEVDGLINAKQEIIDKLSARLDKLEKRMK